MTKADLYHAQLRNYYNHYNFFLNKKNFSNGEKLQKKDK